MSNFQISGGLGEKGNREHFTCNIFKLTLFS